MIKIVILQRGWVFVGRLETDFEMGDGHKKLTNAKCIRRWGTTRGIGELCSGPLDTTELDPAGTVRFHELTAVAIIDCLEDGWHRALLDR